ncbi:MAG: LytR/AlgR family response regulator transcription factor [Desulfitobacteriaceae bacterium]
MMTVVLVDDEAPARAELRFLLEQFPELNVIGEFESGAQSLRYIPGLRPDVIFMDVQLQDMDGLDVVHSLQHLGLDSFIVFATAYDVHAVRAFELNAVDYVLKPFSIGRLVVTVERLKQRQRTHGKELSRTISQLIQEVGLRQRPRKIPVTYKGRVTLIDPQDLLYVIAEGRYSSLVTADKIWPTTFSLQELEERLDPVQFVRTHRAFLVNLDRVKEVIPWFNGTYKIIISQTNVPEIPVSRTYAKVLRERLEL